MKVEHAFSRKAALSAYVGEESGRVCLMFLEPSGERGGESATIWLYRETFDNLLSETGRVISQADRIAAAKRGEAVPAAPVSDGDAARELLRMWVEARLALMHLSPNSLSAGENEKRTFLAAAAFLKIPVAS